MKSANNKVLVSGASIAGLATAYWLHKTGCQVTVVELAAQPRVGGAAVNIQGNGLLAAKQMGIYEQMRTHKLQVEQWEFKDANDVTIGPLAVPTDEALFSGEEPGEEIEIERDKLVGILSGALPAGVEFMFNNSITALRETADAIQVTFKVGAPQEFDLVIGCDGLHSGVRQLWFGHETEYSHFLQHYFSLTIVNELLLPENTALLYNEPGRAIMLNAYNQKTDIVFAFSAEQEISYDYRNAGQQRQLIIDRFAGQGWRTAELLAKMQQAPISYFDKICQIKMPSWSKGRVALVGDAGYCASPAAGMGASLALEGAAALAAALAAHPNDFALAFQAYDAGLRPFIEEVQAIALTMLGGYLVPGTEEAIHARNTQPVPF